MSKPHIKRRRPPPPSSHGAASPAAPARAASPAPAHRPAGHLVRLGGGAETLASKAPPRADEEAKVDGPPRHPRVVRQDISSDSEDKATPSKRHARNISSDYETKPSKRAARGAPARADEEAKVDCPCSEHPRVVRQDISSDSEDSPLPERRDAQHFCLRSPRGLALGGRGVPREEGEGFQSVRDDRDEEAAAERAPLDDQGRTPLDDQGRTPLDEKGSGREGEHRMRSASGGDVSEQDGLGPAVRTQGSETTDQSLTDMPGSGGLSSTTQFFDLMAEEEISGEDSDAAEARWGGLSGTTSRNKRRTGGYKTNPAAFQLAFGDKVEEP